MVACYPLHDAYKTNTHRQLRADAAQPREFTYFALPRLQVSELVVGYYGIKAIINKRTAQFFRVAQEEFIARPEAEQHLVLNGGVFPRSVASGDRVGKRQE